MIKKKTDKIICRINSDEKQKMKAMAMRLGYKTLTAYILDKTLNEDELYKKN